MCETPAPSRLIREAPRGRGCTRLTEAEWARWDARRELSGRAEMGAWVRHVVADAEGLAVDLDGRRDGRSGGRRAGDLPLVPSVNVDAYRQLAGAAVNLNQVARAVNAGAGGEQLRGRLVEVLEALAEAMRAVVGER
jgi:hypothetical protein